MTYPVFASGDVLNASDMNAVGLWLVNKTTFSAASTVSVDNLFSSNYENYRLLIQFSRSTTINPNMQLRASGSATASNYQIQGIFGDNTTISGSRSSGAANWDIFGGNGAGNVFQVIDLYGPNLAANTGGMAWTNNNYSTTIISLNYMIAQNSTTQFTGVQINTNTGNITGTIWTYGYRN